MELFDTLSAQIRHMRLPLFAVSLSAVPFPDTPLLLMLHWHGFRQSETGHAEANKTTFRQVPASALQLTRRWNTLSLVEEEILDAAWQLGAWSLLRDERRGCNTMGAAAGEELACRQAFGDLPPVDGLESVVAEAPDSPELMRLAARRGYVSWQFRPVHGGVWRELAEDDTLSAEGLRQPPCPLAPRACRGGKAARTEYRFGRIERIIL
ncbi:diguanylate cyclase [Chromobacterium amazonense]|uniref:Diguanylate cyclase n=1 Tax=Chromobacterium amazonense TaxID=1382803 RepID=A0A2S9X6F1_9NEIS|nr:diguanylate cyclase [Chromobacterium amazonense]MDQ4541570.1 diguanylate cyclase [Chromobacterium amazonense]PRP71312.1 diguanylate cyclase [Chromobacterium amazonense]